MVTMQSLQGLKEKAEEINLLLLQPSVDLWRLRELALSEGGLVNDSLRKQAWPKLVGIHKFYSVPSRSRQRPGGSSTSKKRNRKGKGGNASGNDEIANDNRDSDYCSRQQAQVEIDASVVVAADQAAEEAAAAAATAATVPSDDYEKVVLDEDDSVVRLHPSILKKATSNVSSNQHQSSNGSLSRRKSTNGSHNGSPTKSSQPSLLVECKDAEQIRRDVTRCTWHLLTGSQRSRRLQYKHKDRRKVGSLLNKKQMRLDNLLNWTLFQSSYQHGHLTIPGEDDGDFLLRYYQGYHDVASIFLAALGGGNHQGNSVNNGGTTSSCPSPSRRQSLSSDVSQENVMKDQDEQEWEKLHADERYRDLEHQAMAMGLDMPSRVLLQLSYSHFRDNLRSSFLQLQVALRLVLFPLLHALDPHGVHAHLVDCDMEPFFCLSWVITWFSHDVRDTELVKRLFDVFIVSHPLFPVYLSLAMMLHPINRGMILNTDCDFAAVHHCLSMLPRNSCRVGWKKRKSAGDDFMDFGYVSDHGEEDDDDEEDGTVATDLDASVASEDWGTGSVRLFDNGSEDGLSGSMVSGSLLSGSISSLGLAGAIPDDEKVPFQELIDTAIQFMKRYPPRCLISLAKSYYRAGETTERDVNPYDHAAPRDRMVMQPPMTEEDWDQLVDTITILQPSPPIWSMSPSTKADWVLKQRARERMGLKSTSRKDRRTNAKRAAAAALAGSGSRSGEGADDENAPIPLVDYQYLKENSRSRAVIACGFGPGIEEERRRRRKQRIRIAVTGVLIVGLFAISVMMVAKSYNEQPAMLPSSTNPNNASDTTGITGGEVAPSASPNGLSHQGKEPSLPWRAGVSEAVDVCPTRNEGGGGLSSGTDTSSSSLESPSVVPEITKETLVDSGSDAYVPNASPRGNSIVGASTETSGPAPTLVRAIGQASFKAHRLFDGVTKQLESKLVKPILEQKYSGFGEELTTTQLGAAPPRSRYAIVSGQRLSKILLYFSRLAEDAQYNLHKCLDVLGIYFLYFSFGSGGNDGIDGGGDSTSENDVLDSDDLEQVSSSTAAAGSSNNNKKERKKLHQLPVVKQVRKSVSGVVGLIKRRIEHDRSRRQRQQEEL